MSVATRVRTGEFGPPFADARWATPGAMAAALDPSTRSSPATGLLDRELVDLVEGDSTRRLMFFMPPQEGKSERVSRRFPAWLLERDPTLRIGIVSYELDTAVRWGRAIKRDIESHPELGIELRADSRAAGRWETRQGGGVYCVGIGGALTGRPVDVLIVDDPVKGRAEAESRTYRDAAWDWWESTAQTRLSSRYRIVLIMCMTGDTPVLMADGTERFLRDVRPGDRVATYENGTLTTSTVRNWANQGPDTIYAIRTKSGTSVRANARHPFLTVENGVETWQRTDSLKPGSRILRVTGGSGAASSAQSRIATSRLGVRACACRTTTGLGGRQVSDRRRSTPWPAATPGSSTGTASAAKSSIGSRQSRTANAPSAVNPRLRGIPGPIGTGSSASITTTTLADCEVCSATTATSQSGTDGHPNGSVPLLPIWSVTPDEVVEVVPAGVEDVFDLQVDRTENFIANGLVSHNTRWHEDDLAGRLLAHEGGEWRLVRIPAIAEENDPLGRAPGVELESVQRRPPGWFRRLKAKLSAYVWTSVYQQSPTAAEGNLFRRGDYRYWRPLPADPSRHGSAGGRRVDLDGRVLWLDDCWRFVTIDLAASKRTSADYTVAACWAIGPDGDLVLLDRARARIEEARHWDLVAPLSSRWAAPDVFVERGFIGTTLVIQATQAGLAVQPLDADSDKVTRALPATHRVAGHRVWFPAAADWLDEWCDELAEFPNGTHDDQVDVLAYAVRVATAHWLPQETAAQQDARRPAYVSTAVYDAYHAATGNGHADPLTQPWD